MRNSLLGSTVKFWGNGGGPCDDEGEGIIDAILDYSEDLSSLIHSRGGVHGRIGGRC